MKRTTRSSLTTVNGIAYIGNQFMGASASVPIKDVYAASLASGVAVGTSTGGNDVAVSPPNQAGAAQ